MNARWSALRWLVGALLLLLPLGCQSAPSPPVDPALLAFLSAARSSHHKADAAERSQDPTLAIAALDGLVRGPRPGSGTEPPEVAEVLADTRARLADLRSGRGQFDAAFADVEAGLALVPAITYFRGHLLEMRGLVHERRAAERRRAGDEAGAAADEKAAISAFDEAISLQGAVIERALGEGVP